MKRVGPRAVNSKREAEDRVACMDASQLELLPLVQELAQSFPFANGSPRLSDQAVKDWTARFQKLSAGERLEHAKHLLMLAHKFVRIGGQAALPGAEQCLMVAVNIVDASDMDALMKQAADRGLAAKQFLTPKRRDDDFDF